MYNVNRIYFYSNLKHLRGLTSSPFPWLDPRRFSSTDNLDLDRRTSKNANNDNIINDDGGYTLSKMQKRALKLPQHETDMDPTEILSLKLKRMKKDSMIQDMEQQERNPQPWHNLLVYSSRALWRSSPNPPPPYLLDAQSHIIKASERTPKQLKRTYERIISNHLSLSELRERERRRMVNGPRHSPSSPSSSSTKPVYYNPEQSVCSLKYRLVPNYSIVRRVLAETQSLLGKESFQPKRVVDVGIGAGSASAAALEYFNAQVDKDGTGGSGDGYNGIEWIHGIDPSQSMRDASNIVLSSIIEGQGKQNSNIQHAKTRLTFGDSILSSSNYRNSSDAKIKSGGSFDLGLCAYTLHEVPSVAACLSMAAILWEKVRPNGVAIFIEPGTPDGFNALRSVRNMLLDVCPPDKERTMSMEGQEECHVIAPCTHNGTCPMVRHQRNFFRNVNKQSSIHGNDSMLMDDDLEEDDNEDVDGEEGELIEDIDDDEEYDLMDDEELEDIQGESIVGKEDEPSLRNASETDVFNTAFCSFVHGMPGKSSFHKQGEKFSYLVVQKRICRLDEPTNSYDESNPFKDINIVDLLNESLDAGANMKNVTKAENQNLFLQRAQSMEDQFINSDQDKLGLELVRGENRKSFGRIIRSPIKKRGHVIIDYCSSTTDQDGSQAGRIVRSKVSRAKSSRYAPGMYSSSRKARWGGFWPDVTKA
jgi:Predicted rRNA methylase